MHPVHDRVRARVQVTRPLDRPGEHVEEPLPPLAHLELTVRAIAVQEEALEHDRELPMDREEDEDRHVLFIRRPRSGCPPRFGHPIRRLSRLCHDERFYTLPLAREPWREGGSHARVGQPVRRPRQRRNEATCALVLSTGAGLEDLEPPFDAEAYSLVIANGEMQKGDVDVRARAPIAPVEARSRHDVEGAPDDLATRLPPGDDPRQPIAEPLDDALEKSLIQVEAPPDAVPVDRSFVEVMHHVREIPAVTFGPDGLDDDSVLLDAPELALDLVTLFGREPLQVLGPAARALPEPVKLKSVASQVPGGFPVARLVFAREKNVDARGAQSTAPLARALRDDARDVRPVDARCDENAVARRRRERDRDQYLGVVTNAQALRELRPAPVEHELSLAVPLGVRRGEGDGLPATPEGKVRGGPARLPADAPRLFEHVEPRPLDEWRAVFAEEGVPLFLGHVTHAFDDAKLVAGFGHATGVSSRTSTNQASIQRPRFFARPMDTCGEM